MAIREVKLGKVATVKGGKRLPKGINLITKPNPHPYIRVRDLNGKKTLELDGSFEFVDDETQKAISRYIVTGGDIVLSIVGTIGLVSVVGDSLNEANLTENCVKLTSLSGIDGLFILLPKVLLWTAGNRTRYCWCCSSKVAHQEYSGHFNSIARRSYTEENRRYSFFS